MIPATMKRWSARFVHWAQAPDQRFRVRASARTCPFLGAFYRDLLEFCLLCTMHARFTSQIDRPALIKFNSPQLSEEEGHDRLYD
jgi:hypothetical protein